MKVSKNVGIIGKARKYLSTEAAKSLYFAFVHPYLAVGNIAWASTYKTRLEKLHRLQKRAVRIISHAEKTCHSRPLMRQLHILNIYEINILQTLTFVYKHQCNMLPVSLTNCLSQVNHRYESRLSRFGYKERTLKGKRRFSISRRGPYLWNRIRCKLATDINTVAQFKYELKKYLLELGSSMPMW